MSKMIVDRIVSCYFTMMLSPEIAVFSISTITSQFASVNLRMRNN